ncbi:protein kinase [Candidatus Uabimicrobium sp. HlEnr_7]|uniref:protein kinase domain-containing protein n=1 Tax=Candidatus Uabimicrobium helgolandensis TaxID=3095367 RepID=UPI003558569C
MEKKKRLKSLRQKRDEYIASHDWYMALETLNDMIEVEKKSSFYTRRAMIWIKLQESKKAIEDLKLALVMNPNDKHAQKTLKKISFNKAFAESGGFSSDVTIFDIETKVKESEEPSFSRYKIIEKLGQGGMGKVYKSYDTHLERIVALKTLLSQDNASKNERFLREAKAIAQLHHPNIIAIHDIANQNGQNFFTMDFIEGTTLKIFSEKNNIGIPHKINLITKIAKALSYAHKNGIIHRDIKPSNIMININHEPVLMDFGLAKITHSEDGLSRTGDAMGTPAYMPVEQIHGNNVDLRADVYALGATLYEILTGRPPFQGESYYNILHQVLHLEPMPMRTLNPDVPVDLEAICMKCLEKNPNKRYSDMLLLIQDLQNFLMNRPVSARPITRWTQLRKFMARHYVIVSLCSFMILSVSSAGIFSFFSWKKAEKQEIQRTMEARQAKRQLAEIALAKAKEAFKRKEWNSCGVLAGEGLHFIRDFSATSDLALKKDLNHYLKLSMQYAGLIWKKQQLYTFSNAAYTNDGNSIISYGTGLAIWDAHSGKIRRFINNSDTTHLAISYDNNYIAYTTPKNSENQITVSSLNNKKTFYHFSYYQRVLSLRFAKKSSKLAVLYADGNIHIWDTLQKKVIHKINNKAQNLQLEFVLNDTALAIISEQQVVIQDLATQKKIAKKIVHEPQASAYHLKKNRLAIACKQVIYIWDLQQESHQEIKIAGEPTYVGFNFDGSLLCCTRRGFDDQIFEKTSVWNINTRIKITKDIENVRAIFHPQKNDLLVFNEGIPQQQWDISTKFSSSLLPNGVYSLDFDPSGKHFLHVKEGIVEIYESQKRKKIQTLDLNRVFDARFSNNGESVVCLSEDTNVYVWNKKNKNIQTLSGHSTSPYYVTFHPEDNLVASSEDKAIIIWNLREKTHRILETEKDYTGFLLFNNDGSLLASSHNSEIKIWDVASGKCVDTIILNNEIYSNIFILALHFQDKSKLIYATSNNVFIYDLQQKKQTKHSLSVTQMENFVVGKDSQYFVAILDKGKKIKIYNALTGEHIQSYTEHMPISAIALSNDNRYLITANSKGYIKFRELFLQKPIRILKASKKVKNIKLVSVNKLLIHQGGLQIYDWHKQETTTRFSEELSKVSFSLSGKYTATFTNKDTSIIETETSKQVWNDQSTETQVAFSPQEKIATLSQNKRFLVFKNEISQEKNRLIYTKRFGDLHQYISFSNSGLYAAVVNGEILEIWNIKTKEVIYKIVITKFLVDVYWSGDDKKIVVRDLQKITIHNIHNKTSSFIIRNSSIYVAAFNFNGQFILLTTKGILKIFDTHTKKMIEIKKYENLPLHIVALGDFVALSQKEKIVILNYKTLEEKKIKGDKRQIKKLLFPSKKRLIVVGKDNNVVVWNLNSKKIEHEFEHNDEIQHILCQENQLTTVANNTLNKWNINNGTKILTKKIAEKIAAIRPQSDEYITIENFNFLSLIDLVSKQQIKEYNNRKIARHVSFLSESEIILQLPKKVVTRNFEQNTEMNFPFTGYSISSDRKLLALIHRKNQEIKIWDIKNKNYIKTYSIPENILSVQYAGEYLIVAHFNSIRIININKEEPQTINAEQGLFVSYLGYDPINKIMAVASEKSLDFWDITKIRKINTYPGRYAKISFLPHQGIAALLTRESQIEIVNFPKQKNNWNNLQLNPRQEVRKFFGRFADSTLGIKKHYSHLKIW